MKCVKTLLTFLFSTALLTLSLCAYDTVRIYINGYQAEISGKLINSTTYVELDEIGELLSRNCGITVDICADEGDCYISARGRYLGGSDCLNIDGNIYVPIRSAAKAYNAGVEWIGETLSVELYAETNYGIEPGDDFYIADEVYWLSRIINAESQGEPMRGKILVGNVVLNRILCDDYPDTIYGVIFDDKYAVQFTPTANGTIYNEPTEESIIAAKICLDDYYISREALYFLNPRIATSFWIPNNREFLVSIGNHDFYT